MFFRVFFVLLPYKKNTLLLKGKTMQVSEPTVHQMTMMLTRPARDRESGIGDGSLSPQAGFGHMIVSTHSPHLLYPPLAN